MTEEGENSVSRCPGCGRSLEGGEERCPACATKENRKSKGFIELAMVLPLAAAGLVWWIVKRAKGE